MKDNEIVVLGSVLFNPTANAHYLYSLASVDYKFSEEYQKLNEYLLRKTFELPQGVRINEKECLEECGLNDKQLEYIKLIGEQDPKPSYEYILDNKKLYDYQNLFKGFKGATVADYQDFCLRITNIETLREFKTHRQIDDNIADIVDSIVEGKVKLYKSPFETWNTQLRGINPEDLIVLGAYSGVGKTHLAIQTSLSALEDGGRVMYISAENSEEEVKTRFGAHIAKVYETSLYDVHSDNCKKLLRGIRTIGDKFDKTLTLSRLSVFEDIITVMKARSTANMDDLYVLDYIQLFRSRKKYSSEREQLADFSAQLVDFVGKFKKPVIVLSQLVQGETESFKGAQELLNMATVGGFIFKSKELEVDNKNGDKFYRVKVNFKKVRRGSSFVVYGKIYPSDPAIHEINIGLTLENKELWNIEPHSKSR